MEVQLTTARGVQVKNMIVAQNPGDIIVVSDSDGQRLIDEGAAKPLARQKPERRTAK